MNSNPLISIILPVHNEGANIQRQIEMLEKTLDEDHEILIIYDFDEDNTVAPAKTLLKRYKSIRLEKNTFGVGLINAVKTGFTKAKGAYLVVMPADLADNPETVNKMYKKMLDGYDIVCATRYSKGGNKIGGSLIKTLLSKMAGLSTPYLLGINTTDIANGFKMYRKKIFNSIEIESTGGWEFSLEIIIKANQAGFKIAEVPTVWRDRVSGKSKFKLVKWLPLYARWYLWGIFLNINRPRFRQ